jgi:hypothetical protein
MNMNDLIEELEDRGSSGRHLAARCRCVRVSQTKEKR